MRKVLCNSRLKLTQPVCLPLFFLPDGSDEGDGDKLPSISIDMVGECKGHAKPVTCVRFHPSAAVVLTASKDGTCRCVSVYTLYMPA